MEHMGQNLSYHKFNNLQNPFGILFHPKAIENLIKRALEKRLFRDTDLIYQNGLWHSYEAHSSLSDISAEMVLKRLNDKLKETLEYLTHSTHIIFTLGTAWVYRHNASGLLVANCHKVPQKEFTKELLSIDAITSSLEQLLRLIRSVNQEAQILFTVSPVRHLKDGFIENQRSKAHLIAAIHQVVKDAHITYFPSYEIMMDELRDYRFYESDMIHPNAIGISYIWEKFRETWISDNAIPTMKAVAGIQKSLEHRPFNVNSEEYKDFQKAIKSKITALQKTYPFMKFNL